MSDQVAIHISGKIYFKLLGTVHKQDQRTYRTINIKPVPSCANEMHILISSVELCLMSEDAWLHR